MKKLISLLVFIPVGLVLVIISVANREPVTLHLDPINAQSNLSITLPFFVFLFAAIILGMVLGSMATWWTQGKHRKSARRSNSEIRQLRRENEELAKKTATETPKTASGLPILTDRNAA